MKRRNGRIAAVILALLAVLALAGAMLWRTGGQEAQQEGNLLVNGDFSAVTGGMPDGWETGMWVTSVGASYLEAATSADGRSAVLVENAAANDARFEQTVAVRENTTYCLSALVMAEGCDGNETGANVSFLGVYGTSEDVHDTQGQWQRVSLYARTGKGQKEVTVCVRLGGYGSETTGRAWFTDVTLEQVSEAPLGATVLSLATPTPKKETAKEESAAPGEAAIPLLLCAAAAYLLLAALIVQTLLRPRHPALRGQRQGGAALALLLALAFALRLALALNV